MVIIIFDIDIDSIVDPKKRKLKIQARHKERLIKSACSFNNSIKSNTFRESSSNMSLKASRASMMRSTFQKNKLTGSLNNMSAELSKESIYFHKGELIGTYYSNAMGVVKIIDLPYDSYLVEVEDSKSYELTAIPLQFNNVSNDRVIKKFIGLKQQSSSYIELYVYETSKTDSLDMGLLSGSEVYLRRCRDQFDVGLNDDYEVRFKLNENKNIPGRFECSVVPGDYLVEVSKAGYETVKKQYNFVNGENKINIQMNQNNKLHKIKVTVVNYENIESRLENVHIKVNFEII